MIFVDTSALYAVLDRDDEFHAQAAAQWAELLSGPSEVLTSNYVIVECFALIQRRLGIDAVRIFSADVLPVITVQWISADDHEAATQALLAAARRDLSLVDCASFVLMRDLGIRSAFAFDEDFEQQGFQMIPDSKRG